MKKILVFVDWFAPGYKAGGPITSCVNLVKVLNAKAGVSVVTTDTDYNERTPYPEVTSDAWTSYRGIRTFYFSLGSLRFKSIKRILVAEHPDVIYLNSMFSLYFTIIPFLISKIWLPSVRIVIAPRGMLAKGALSIKPLKKKIFLSLMKLTGVRKVTWHATNDDEANDIRKIFTDAVVHVAPNFVSLQEHKPAHISKEKKELRLVSIARISPEKNLLYALEVLAEVNMPVRLTIYGSVNNTTYWKKCEQLVKQMPQHEIVYKGPLEPADIPDVLTSSHFLFMPTLGENFGHVIFESLACGTPVVISDRTPWKGLKAADVGYDLPLENRSAFARCIEDLYYMDGLSYELMSEAAYQFATSFANGKNDLNSYKFLFS